MRYRYQGFTLVELVIVVAIAAILTAIAVPLYLNYVARVQSTAALSLASGLEPNMVEFYNEHGKFPTVPEANASVGAAAAGSISGRYVQWVAINDHGWIVARYCTFGEPGCEISRGLSGVELALSPITHAGSIEWHCKIDEPSAYPLVPASCRGEHTGQKNDGG